MDSSLTHWKTVPLGDIAHVQSGGTPSRGNQQYWNGNIPWVKISDIKSVYVTEAEEGITDLGLKNSSARIFPAGTILFTIFATIGRVGILKFDAATNQAIAGITPRAEIDHKFFYYALVQFSNKLIDQGKGVAQKNINLSILKTLPIPFPPLPEQKRIVAKLDTLFAHLDQLRSRLDKIPVLLKQFRQAVLTQAVTGKLTEEWRKGKQLDLSYYRQLDDKIEHRETVHIEIPLEWQWRSFSAVADVKSNLVPPLDYLEKPLIAPDNIEPCTGNLLNQPLVKEIMPKSPKHLFMTGDIIYSKIRPYLSKLIIADFEGLCSADMYPIRAKISTKFLFFYMLSNEFLEFAVTAGTRTVLPKINQNELSIIPVPLPTIEEQEEIVRRIEFNFQLAARVQARHQILKGKLDRFPEMILSKSFCGELVKDLD